MAILSAHLNDAGITFVNEEKIICQEPGFALIENNNLITGSEAFANASIKPRQIQNEYWSNLQIELLSDYKFKNFSSADLVNSQLKKIWQSASKKNDQLVIAIPAYMSHENIGLLLGIAEELNIPVTYVCDAAVCATRRQYKDAALIHLDLSLHSILLTRINQKGCAQIDRSVIVKDCGLLSLYEKWLSIISEAFVRQSRFDPLHSADTEQLIRDQLPYWLLKASSSSVINLEIKFGDTIYRANIESKEFISAAMSIYKKIINNLRVLIKAGETPAVQFTDRASKILGLAKTIQEHIGGEFFLLEPGATARGLIKRYKTSFERGGLSLSQKMPWDQSEIIVRKNKSSKKDIIPTHLLFKHHAYSLNGDPIVVGTKVNNDERSIDIKESMPGVSRRHCVISSKDGHFIVTDNSRYGTYLNGNKIEESALLQVGDVIRIGVPGIKFSLISVEDSFGS